MALVTPAERKKILRVLFISLLIDLVRPIFYLPKSSSF
jgi:hypothetical protein